LTGFSADGLSPLDHEFKPGEIIGVGGIEGNGQRTLLRAIAGLEKSSGKLAIDGRAIRNPSPAKATRLGISYLSGDRHNEGVLTDLTVGENITMRSLSRLGKADWVGDGPLRRLGQRVVDDFNVKTPTLETPIESLSGGNQQKALLGGVLVSGASIYLVDEPTQGVDVGARAEIYSLLREAAAAGAVVIVLSSSSLELAGLADRVLVFSRGQAIKELSGPDLTEEAITGTILTATTERARAVKREHRVAGWLAGDAAPIVIVAGLIVVLTVVGTVSSGKFLGLVNVSGILGLAVPLAIVAIAQCLVLLTGGIDLSAGPLMGLVAIVGSYYVIDNATPSTLITGWILMFIIAVVVGLLNWLLIEVVKLAPLIATLVTYMALQAISLILRPVPGGSISSSVTSLLGASWGALPVSFVFAACLAVAFEIWLKRSRAGIALRAVGSRSEAARVNGLNPRLTRLFAYVGCSVLAALAGVFLMVQTGIGDPTQGISYTLTGITAAVVGGASVFGGRASFVGATLGAVIVGVVSALTVFLHATADWQYYLIGGMTLGAVALYSLARQRVAVRK
jgi:ribose transport system ATP-binding protein